MLLRTDPDMAIAPFTQFTQFLYFRMAVLHIVLLRQASWVEYSDITAKAKQYSCGFVCQKTREGSGSGE